MKLDMSTVCYKESCKYHEHGRTVFFDTGMNVNNCKIETLDIKICPLIQAIVKCLVEMEKLMKEEV